MNYFLMLTGFLFVESVIQQQIVKDNYYRKHFNLMIFFGHGYFSHRVHIIFTRINQVNQLFSAYIADQNGSALCSTG